MFCPQFRKQNRVSVEGEGGWLQKVFFRICFFLLKIFVYSEIYQCQKMLILPFRAAFFIQKINLPTYKNLKKVKFWWILVVFLPIVWSNFQYFTRVFPNCFFFFFDYLSHLCKNYFWKKIEFSTTYKHFENSFFLCTVTRDPNIGSSIKAFGSRFWSTIKKGWSSFDRAVKKKTSFQSGVWFDLMLKKKWSVIDLWSSFKNLIWFDPTLAQESWVWSTFDRPLKTWFDLIQLSLKQVEFDRPLIVLWKLDLIWSNSRSRKLSLIDLWSSFKNLIVL